jgi:transposase InsO family protein
VCTKPSLPPEPFKSRPPPTRTFEKIHTDFGEINGGHFLVLVDSFSGWTHLVAFRDKSTTARQVVEQERKLFSKVGAHPLTFWSDNGPQFGAAEFRSFQANWGITDLTSSPHFAQSNGHDESEINTMKSLIHGSWTSGAFNAAKFKKKKKKKKKF